MPTRVDDDSSDWSDDDERSEVETSVLLGIPDGTITKESDMDDAAVSRIGGHPAFLSSTEPSISSSQCKNCSFPMELLVQLWCPFEESTMDRALYIFGCSRRECQRKDGSVRAFRGLRYNAKYAAKLEAKAARRREKEAAREKEKEKKEHQRAVGSINPFSMSSGVPPSGGIFGGTSLFGAGTASSGLGSHIFGSSPTDDEAEHEGDNASLPPSSDSEDSNSDNDNEDTDDDESEKAVLAALASTPSSSSPWSATSTYKPLYLSTALEFIPPPPKVKAPPGMGDDHSVTGGGKSRKAEERREKEEQLGWNNAMEGYEDSMDLDKVFERFARRIGYEGEQCIRYELSGTPLPFAHDTHFDSLFPSLQAASSSQPGHRLYDTKSSAIKPCPRCRSRRVFECQLVPHLISLLEHEADSNDSKTGEIKSSRDGTRDSIADAAVEARRKQVEQLLKGGEEKRGMEWGTAMIFSCEKDCCLEDGKEMKEIWAEEQVIVQWEE